VRNPFARQTPLSAFPVIDGPQASAFLRSRRSIRCYQESPILRDVLFKLLEIARFAPSGHNSQGISYIIVEDREALQRIRAIVVEWMGAAIEAQPELAKRLHMPAIVKAHEAGEDKILRGAPQVIFACGERRSGAVQVSTYLALEYVELYATVLGLGTCWAGYVQVCAQQYSKLAAYLNVPDDLYITGAMMVGYPKYSYHRLPDRNPLQVIWHNAARDSANR
jgi:nitroreductase